MGVIRKEQDDIFSPFEHYTLINVAFDPINFCG